MTDTLIFLQELGLTLLLGGLIGLERERNHEKEKVHDFGGIRTMSLVGIFAYMIYSLFGSDPLLFSVFTGGFLLLLVSSYLVSSFVNKSIGATTEMGVMFVYLIGVLMAMGHLVVAAATTLIVVSLLHFKHFLHRFAHTVEREEIYDTFKFIAVTFIVLPLLPNETFGPLDVLNPYVIWLMVVLITGISFVSYIAIKALGPTKGIGVGGFFGGLISSTAVAMSFSGLSRKAKTVVNPFIFGILVASSAMFFRVLLEVSVLSQNILPYLYWPMLSMGFVGFLASLYFWFAGKKEDQKKLSCKDINLKSPFQLWPALQFAFLFALLLLLSKFMNNVFGEEGLYLTAFVSGFVDVDAITVSMANLTAAGDLVPRVAAIAITIATMANTFVKGTIVLSFASPAVGRRMFGVTLVMILVGLLAVFFFMPPLG